jgi:hypothetical protein
MFFCENRFLGKNFLKKLPSERLNRSFRVLKNPEFYADLKNANLP